MREDICCICGEKFEGYGNNPAPIVMNEVARCCDVCDSLIVIPERIRRVFSGRSARGYDEMEVNNG